MRSSDTGENLGTSLIRSIGTPGTLEVALDIGELALDSFLDEGLLKDIPVFGWFLKGYGVVENVRDRLFLKKVGKFLSGVGSISGCAGFAADIQLDEDLCRKVGENILLLLDRHEDFEKSYMLGKVFAGYLEGNIDYPMFLKLGSIIDRSFLSDLNSLKTYYNKIDLYDPKAGKPFSDSLDEDISQSLYNSGLVRSYSYTEDTYHKNEAGNLLIKLLYE